MLKIIYKTNDFLAINKPAGMLVHPVGTSKTFEGTVVGELLESYPEICCVGDKPDERPGVVHRLDKDTSGVLVVARTQKFFEYLKGQFQAHTIEKSYLALVHGSTLASGFIDKPIGLRSGTTKRSVSARKMKMIKEAFTEYKTIKHFHSKLGIFSFVRLIPRTGRTHQLRVHMSAIGFQIVGDPLYGKKKNPFGLTHQFLHAEVIEFSLENGKRMRIEAELPEELENVLKILKK